MPRLVPKRVARTTFAITPFGKCLGLRRPRSSGSNPSHPPNRRTAAVCIGLSELVIRTCRDRNAPLRPHITASTHSRRPKAVPLVADDALDCCATKTTAQLTSNAPAQAAGRTVSPIINTPPMLAKTGPMASTVRARCVPSRRNPPR